MVEKSANELLKEIKVTNDGIQVLTKDLKKGFDTVTRKLDSRTRMSVVLSAVATICTVLAFMFSHQAHIIYMLKNKTIILQEQIDETQKAQQEFISWQTQVNDKLSNRKIGSQE